MEEKRTFVDKFSDSIMKLAEPMSKISQVPAIDALQKGLITTLPLTIIGSLFLLLGTFSAPLTEGDKPLLAFLAPWSSDFKVIFALTMNLLSLYVVAAVAMAYAKNLKNVPEHSAALLGISSYLLLSYNGLTERMLPAGQLSSSGLFVAIIVGLLSTKIYSLMVKNNIMIKMPEGVPPAIASAFNGLIPYLVVFTLAWTIRTLFNFDIHTWLNGLLQPILGAADNIFVFTFANTLKVLLWSVGLHGDNMVNPATTAFLTQWIADNANAVDAGNPAPHLWVQGVERMAIWPATVWPLVILMYTSKVKYLRTFAKAATPSAIFTIVEPIMFGLPLVLNPYLIVPFITSALVSCVITYGSLMIGFVTPIFANLPWVTPPFILGLLGSGGDWRWLIVLALNIGSGLLIYLPFWKVYEKIKLKEQEQEAQA